MTTTDSTPAPSSDAGKPGAIARLVSLLGLTPEYSSHPFDDRPAATAQADQTIEATARTVPADAPASETTALAAETSDDASTAAGSAGKTRSATAFTLGVVAALGVLALLGSIPVWLSAFNVFLLTWCLFSIAAVSLPFLYTRAEFVRGNNAFLAFLRSGLIAAGVGGLIHYFNHNQMLVAGRVTLLALLAFLMVCVFGAAAVSPSTGSSGNSADGGSPSSGDGTMLALGAAALLMMSSDSNQ